MVGLVVSKILEVGLPFGVVAAKCAACRIEERRWNASLMLLLVDP